MSTYTPDSWIERHWLDEPPSDNPCEDGVCWHVSHCDVCEKPMDYRSDSGCCIGCDVEWAAKHQLAEITCPKCGSNDIDHVRHESFAFGEVFYSRCNEKFGIWARLKLTEPAMKYSIELIWTNGHRSSKIVTEAPWKYLEGALADFGDEVAGYIVRPLAWWSI